MGKMARMNHRPPTTGLSRATRLLAAIIIAITALGITWMAEQRLSPGPETSMPLPLR
jgi:hypothetical protein